MLRLSPPALKDLKKIYDYSVRRWGKQRARTYMHVLKRALSDLALQPEMGVERSELRHQARSFVVGSHIVYYQVLPPDVEIIRVLHERQDATRTLS